MILDMERVVIELEYRGIVPVEGVAGTRIDCLRGRIWITERRSTDDIVLEAGESYVTSRSGVAVVQALREALVGLRAPAVHQAGASSRRGQAALESVGCARGRRASGHCAAGSRLI
jgi:hypothetical protein